MAEPRSFALARRGVAKARDLLCRGQGFKTKAIAALNACGLLKIHLTLRNPFLELPHADFDCFPMDRLHGVYVCLHACCGDRAVVVCLRIDWFCCRSCIFKPVTRAYSFTGSSAL